MGVVTTDRKGSDRNRVCTSRMGGIYSAWVCALAVFFCPPLKQSFFLISRYFLLGVGWDGSRCVESGEGVGWEQGVETLASRGI